MPEPTSADRLAQIRNRSERLAAIPLETSTENRIMRNMIDSIGDVRWLLAEVNRLRTQLAEIGEAEVEWGVAPAEDLRAVMSAGKKEAVARQSVANDPKRRVLMSRPAAGEWREVPDA